MSDQLTWPQARLDKVANVKSGSGFPQRFQGLLDQEYPFFKVGDMNTPGNETEMHIYQHSISEETRKKLHATLFAPQTIIFPKIGAAIGTNKKRILVRASCIDNNVMAIVPDEKLILPSFLFYIFQIKNLSDFASDANPPSIRASEVESWKIPLPPLPEQRRIVAILRKADELRQLRREANAKAQKLLPALFYEMFHDSDSFEFVKLTRACKTPEHIKCGPFGTQLAKNEYKSEGVPLWGIKHVNAHFAIQTDEFLSEEKAKMLEDYSLIPGDIVMTRKGTVGNCALYPPHLEKGIMHSDLLRIRPDPTQCIPEFLVTQLNYSAYVANQIERLSPGAVMAGINVTKLKQIEIFLPDISKQKDFKHQLTILDRIIRNSSGAHNSYDELFQSLLTRAFTGELTEAWREAHTAELAEAAAERDRLLGSAQQTIELKAAITLESVTVKATATVKPSCAIYTELDSATQALLAATQARPAYFRAEDLVNGNGVTVVQAEAGLRVLAALGFVRQVGLDGQLVYRRVDAIQESAAKPALLQ